MKKATRKILYILLNIYILYFISGCCDFCYQAWDSTPWAYQEYQMDSMTLDSFKVRYMKFCQKKKVKKTYCSPYDDDTDSVKFIHNFGERQGLINCSYCSNELNVLMNFSVEDKEPLEIHFYGVVLSCENKTTLMDPMDYAWNINDGSKTWGEHNKYMEAFENEILKNIGSYRRNSLQGFLCWYSFFFFYHFFYIVLLGVFLVLLLVGISKNQGF